MEEIDMAKLIDYSFKVGKEFEQKKAANAKEYLESALGIHEYLEKFKIETEDGIVWQDVTNVFSADKKVTDLSQYGGTSGPLYFYLGLYEVTKDEKYKELIFKAADYLSKNWNNQKAVIKENISLEGLEYSVYSGTSSIGEVLSKVYELLGREKDLETVKAITYDIIKNAKETEEGLAWSYDKSPLLGGGVVLYLYKIYELLKDETILEAANKGADAIVAEAIKDERGGYAWRSYAHPNQTRVPNFECGTAGVGYILAVAYEISKNEKYLEAAKEAAKHILAIAVKQGDGFLVPWHDNPNEDVIFYLSTCHGPAGTSRLFYQLYKVTNDEGYLAHIDSLYKGQRHVNAPEKQSVGYWNNVGICCGAAGITQFAINYNILTNSEDSKDLAELTGSILLGQQEKQEDGKSIAWPIAYERVKPQNISRAISYAAGVAGIGVALIQLYLFFEDKYQWIRLFDDPYPAKKEA